MRYSKVLLLSILFCGCGDSAQQVVFAPGTATGPAHAFLAITEENALTLSRVVNELTIPSGRHSLEVAGGDLTHIEIDGVAAALVELPLAFPVLDAAPSGTFAGHGGGSAALNVVGLNVTMTFNDFITEDHSTLNGTVFMTGDLDGHSGHVEIDFRAFEVHDVDGEYQIDGPATLFIHRILTGEGHEEIVERTMSVTVTDLRGGGTAEFIGITSDSDIVTENGIQTGLSDNHGSFLFRDFNGLNGLVERIPVEHYGFTVDESTHVSTVHSGESLLQGDGVLRNRVTAPNMLELALRAAGSSHFEVLATVDISDVDLVE